MHLGYSVKLVAWLVAVRLRPTGKETYAGNHVATTG